LAGAFYDGPSFKPQQELKMKERVRGKAFVLGDDIDTDQIIPAEHLVLNPAIPAERKLFGQYALCGVPPEASGLPQGNRPFVVEGEARSAYAIIVAGRNFGCGSSREHAPLALAEAGIEVVVAENYARIFFRNAVNGGYLVPYETPRRLCDPVHTDPVHTDPVHTDAVHTDPVHTDPVHTDDDVEIDLNENKLINHTQGKTHELRPLGDILPIIEAGDIFAYAKNSGMLKL
jgi:3-isopropylmalate/(R)-2-methylmalate dehydratase small subunit